MATREKAGKKYTSSRSATTAKQGRRAGPLRRPPPPTHSVAVLVARSLRKRRLNGAFGAAPPSVWNQLIQGTKGEPRQKQKDASPEAKAIRWAQRPDKHSYKGGNHEDEDA